MASEFYTNMYQHRGKIYTRGYRNDKRFIDSTYPKPYLWVPNNGKKRDEGFRALDGTPVARVQFDTSSEAREFLAQYEGVPGFKIYGTTNWMYQYLKDRWSVDIKYDLTTVRIVGLDIEVHADETTGFPDIRTANLPITIITMSLKGKYYTFGLKVWRPKDPNVTYVLCEDEADLLEKFLEKWQEIDPDVVTGWNIDFFDIPYLVNRINRVLGDNHATRLSPYGILDEKEIEVYGRPQQAFVPAGIAILDYLRVYKKFSFKNHESFKLDYIANVELNEAKLDYSDVGSLTRLYDLDFDRFCEYNVHDVRLVDRLESKLKLLELIMTMAYMFRVNYDDVFATVRPWETFIHSYLLDRKIVMPPKKSPAMDADLIGAYVKDPEPSAYDWVVSFDLNSLYPNLIRMLNISPETKIQRGVPGLNKTIDQHILADDNRLKDFIQNADAIMAANMVLYRKDMDGFLPALVSEVLDGRNEYKKKMLDAKKVVEQLKNDGASAKDIENAEKEVSSCHNFQYALKVAANSLYGAIANKYFAFYDHDNAEAITSTGQLAIRWIGERMNAWINNKLKTNNVDYIIASDTDSMYVNLGPLVKQAAPKNITTTAEMVSFVDKICQKVVEPFINEQYDEFAEYVNANKNFMKMKRESIADVGIWTKKKRYILNVWDNEGVRYQEPKVKITGLEAVRSTTPVYVQKLLKEGYRIALQETQESALAYIDKIRNDFNTKSFMEIAMSSGVNGIDKYTNKQTVFSKGAPMHVKAAIWYNHIIMREKLSNKYRLINEGDKIKYWFLRMPNNIGAPVIAVPDETIPEEMEFESYIDRNALFERLFFTPYKTILDARGWRSEDIFTLEDFFN